MQHGILSQLHEEHLLFTDACTHAQTQGNSRAEDKSPDLYPRDRLAHGLFLVPSHARAHDCIGSPARSSSTVNVSSLLRKLACTSPKTPSRLKTELLLIAGRREDVSEHPFWPTLGIRNGSFSDEITLPRVEEGIVEAFVRSISTRTGPNARWWIRTVLRTPAS